MRVDYWNTNHSFSKLHNSNPISKWGKTFWLPDIALKSFWSSSLYWSLLEFMLTHFSCCLWVKMNIVWIYFARWILRLHYIWTRNSSQNLPCFSAIFYYHHICVPRPKPFAFSLTSAIYSLLQQIGAFGFVVYTFGLISEQFNWRMSS